MIVDSSFTVTYNDTMWWNDLQVGDIVIVVYNDDHGIDHVEYLHITSLDNWTDANNGMMRYEAYEYWKGRFRSISNGGIWKFALLNDSFYTNTYKLDPENDMYKLLKMWVL